MHQKIAICWRAKRLADFKFNLLTFWAQMQCCIAFSRFEVYRKSEERNKFG
jgi:hypothetical protein